MASQKPGLEEIAHSVSTVNGITVAAFKGLELTSAFQPVFGIAQGRAVGYEGLLRAVDMHGTAVAPPQVFKLAQTPEEVAFLDTLCRIIHARNLARLSPNGHWLFLNISLMALVEEFHEHERYFAGLLAACGIPARRVVIEVLESALHRDRDLFRAMAFYRELGCLIAVDDFGAGHSNLDRVWRLKPDIVKLDRLLTRHSAEDQTARMFFNRMVSTMHEAGSLVAVEGVEIESQAIIATDANADLVQGYYFARPSPLLQGSSEAAGKFDELHRYFERIAELELRDYRAEVAPYVQAIENAAARLQAGAALADAVLEFLALPLAERCFVLNRAGRQIGDSILSRASAAQGDFKYEPLAGAEGSYWGHRYYFRRAISIPGEVHLARPYLSVPTARRCVTVSMAFPREKPEHVLCGDMQWIDHLATDMGLA
jgi:EAL domain-containing protein (putative c-di-GMP-specific phosphodiesterase class I)